MLLMWGPAFTQIYNDAYSKLIGDKHPAALGIDLRVTLAESWQTLGPMIAQVMCGATSWWWTTTRTCRDDFLSVASHELKTPLTAFRLRLELVSRNLGPEAQARVGGRIASAARQLARLSTLVERMRDVSQIATGRLTLSPGEVDLAALAGDALERMREEAAQAGTPLVLHAGDPLVGRCDKGRMEQVLGNLLHNAVKYGAGKAVEVRVAASGGVALLTVADHGMGVSPEDRRRIFERFERAVSARNCGGFGLGLWIAREVVEAHGGTLSVADTPGGGATFTVELPLDGPAEEGEDVGGAAGRQAGPCP